MPKLSIFKSTANKISQIRSLTRSIIQLSKRAIARANKGINDQQVNIIFIELHYGGELAYRVKKYMDENNDSA